MKTLRLIFWACVALLLILIGLANKDIVTLRAFPEVLGNFLNINPSIEVPVFVAIFAGVGIGLMIGFLWEWVREFKHRAQLRKTGRELKALKVEMDRMRDMDHDGKDDVLAIIERA